MYTRAEVSNIKQSFWTAFGKYLSPHLSSEGEKINWVNYKTGFKNLNFRMEADTKKASIFIEISHSDLDLQHLFFDKFMELKPLLLSSLEEDWIWDLHVPDENGRLVSKIFKEISPVNVLDQNSWPEIISFFKPRIIALDSFWNDVKLLFEELR